MAGQLEKSNMRNWQVVKSQRRAQVGSERVMNTNMTPAVRDLRGELGRRAQNETVWVRVRGVQKSQ